MYSYPAVRKGFSSRQETDKIGVRRFKDLMPTRNSKENIAALQKTKEELSQGGGAERVAKQHNEGKLTARERLEMLLDRGTFQETGMFAQHRATLFGMAGKPLPADGVVTGSGKVTDALVHVASQDFTVAGGSAGEVHGYKIADSLRHSLEDRHAVHFHQRFGRRARAGGRRQPVGLCAIFYQNVMLSGVVPQISLICGPCAGGAAYSPALTDFIIQTRYA